MKALSLKPLPITLVVLATIAVPSVAQQNQSPPRDQASQADDKQRVERSSPSRERDAAIKADPMARMTIAVDRDNDGQFDAIETVTYYDLQVALQRSKQRGRDRSRPRSMSQRRSPSSGVDRSGPSDQEERRMRPNYDRSTHQVMRAPRLDSVRDRKAQLIKLSGKITQMTTFSMSDQDEHRFVKVALPSGEKVPVDLGPARRTDRLDLKDGDQLTVIGKRARINDKKFICARQVAADDQTVSINQKPDRDMKRVQGRVTELMTKRFKGKDQPYQIAKVDLQGGRNELVILGPKTRLSDLDLAEGEKVRLLVRRGRYNDRPALIATQINRGDQTVRVEKPREKRLSPRKDSSRS